MTKRPWFLGHTGANPYFAFTDRCNDQRPIITLASGQACVWYRLTLASKDGDWIIREDKDACAQVLQHLSDVGARYRCGAPLDLRWLRAGWSSHFEATDPSGLRLRFDFVARPPRIPANDLMACWAAIDQGAPAIVPPEILIPLKQTMRLKDYPFIGALAMTLQRPEDRVRWSLDPDDLCAVLTMHPHLRQVRPSLHSVALIREAVETAIDQEIRHLRRADEARLAIYSQALEPFASAFRATPAAHGALPDAHDQVVALAQEYLPTHLPVTFP